MFKTDNNTDAVFAIEGYNQSCPSGYCIDGFCCNSACSGNCDKCNAAGSEGTCTNVNSECTGNCDYCSNGNCAADESICESTYKCSDCTGSGNSFSCAFAVENNDCDPFDLQEISTCDNNPDNYHPTWDFRSVFDSQCTGLDQCSQGDSTITHTCSVNNCGAECDSTHSCQDKCVGDTRYFSGSCNSTCGCVFSITDCNAQDGCYAYDTGCEDRNYYCTPGSCDYTYSGRNTDYKDSFVNYCSADTVRQHRTNHDFYCSGACSDHTSWTDDSLVQDCSLQNGWYDSGQTRWINETQCTERQQKEQKYRTYTCSNAQCTYANTSTQWINTTSTRNKNDGTSCNDNLYCTVSDQCTSGICGGSARDCSSNNLQGIATCDWNPDNYHPTWDFRNLFTSACDESNDRCTTGDATITHTCSKSQCGAQCVSDADCGTGRTCKADCTCTAVITPPTITIISPLNKTYYSNSTPLTFSISESTSWIGYSLDGAANKTITGNIIMNVTDGPHNVIVYANGTSGNMGSSQKIYFTNNQIKYLPWETSFISTETYPVVDIEEYNGKLYFAANNKLYVFNGNSWNIAQTPTNTLSLQNYSSKLYVAGSGGKIYSFDGSTFTEVFNTNGQYAKMLGVYNNRLYAATYLASPAKLYYFDGSSWQQDTAFSGILSCPAPFCSIDSMSVYNGKMYVGSGGTVYSYNGLWSVLKTYADAYAYQDMKVYNNKLYLATRDQSTKCPYPQGNGFCGRVIEYDGTNWNTKFDYNYWIYSLEAYNGRLYAGTADRIYMYDGSNWQLTFNSLEGSQYALVLKAWNNKIYVGFGNGVMFKDDMLEPVVMNITSPKNIAYNKNYVPLTFTISKPTTWIGYSLDGAANKTITGSVNLTGIANGQRNLKLFATDKSGKTASSSVSFFYCLADVNGDKRINIVDMSMVQALFGKKCGVSGYNNSADLNNDCKIDMLDVAIVSGQFGKAC